jgi:beta-mannosidase
MGKIGYRYVLACLLGSAATQQVTDLSTYGWTLRDATGNVSVPATIPSQAHLDLAAAGVVGQLDYGLNDFELRWIWQQNWTYSTTLDKLNHSAAQTYLLFQGLDTFTSIELCGQHVASTNNQFRQYFFEVSHILSNCSNATLSINFGSAPKIAEDIANEPGQETWPYGVEIPFEIPNRQFIRKEQNDFGWDWYVFDSGCDPELT